MWEKEIEECYKEQSKKQPQNTKTMENQDNDAKCESRKETLKKKKKKKE